MSGSGGNMYILGNEEVIGLQRGVLYQYGSFMSGYQMAYIKGELTNETILGQKSPLADAEKM